MYSSAADAARDWKCDAIAALRAIEGTLKDTDDDEDEDARDAAAAAPSPTPLPPLPDRDAAGAADADAADAAAPAEPDRNASTRATVEGPKVGLPDRSDALRTGLVRDDTTLADLR